MQTVICDIYDPEIQDVRSLAIGQFQTEELAYTALTELRKLKVFVGGEVVPILDSVEDLGYANSSRRGS